MAAELCQEVTGLGGVVAGVQVRGDVIGQADPEAGLCWTPAELVGAYGADPAVLGDDAAIGR